jgi:hypothetical protein
MTEKAQGAKVLNIALTASFSYWNDVIGVPKALSPERF